jgi:hypothetical protein
MTSLSSIVSSANSVVASRPATTKASDELQSLFAKLHMDAIASSAPSTAATTAASTTGATKPDLVTGIVSGLRSVLDGTVSAASAARSAVKAVGTYTSGAGVAGLALHAVDKLA